jgi:hypothetical protein
MKVILMVFLMLKGSTSVFSQQVITGFSLSSQNVDTKSLSLGSATVSLEDGYGSMFINPAGIGKDGVFQVSPDFNSLRHPYAIAYNNYQLAGTYDLNKSKIGISIQGFRTGGQLKTIYFSERMNYKFRNTEVAYSYELNSNLKIGASINHLFSGESGGTLISAQNVDPVHSWSFDLGLQYEFSREAEVGMLKPSFGLALTNFGKGVNYYGGSSTSPLPTRLQAGAGLTFISSQKRNDRNIFEIRVLQNVSNTLAQMERRETNSGFYLEAMNPLKALVKSWGNHDYFDGQNRIKSSLREQISWLSGAEVKFVETFAIRWGLRKAGKYEEDMSYQSLGLGIDLFYVVLDYAFVFDNPEYGDFLEGNHWQLTGRIPLDGSRPDSILKKIL